MVNHSKKRLMPARRWTVVGVLAVAAWAAACGDEGTGPTVQGSFSATITGDMQRTLSGVAVFGVDTIAGNEGFVIALQRGTSGTFDVDVILLGRYNSARPGVGTYDIVASGCPDCSLDDFDAGYVYQYPDGEAGIFVSESGLLTITTSTADSLAGTLELAVHEFGDDTTQLSISAQFTAVRGTIPSVPGT